MRVASEIIDITILDEGFSLGALIMLYAQLMEFRCTLLSNNHEELISSEVQAIDEQLFYINSNIQVVESSMAWKEAQVFIGEGEFKISLN